MKLKKMIGVFPFNQKRYCDLHHVMIQLANGLDRPRARYNHLLVTDKRMTYPIKWMLNGHYYTVFLFYSHMLSPIFQNPNCPCYSLLFRSLCSSLWG
jgi:hypothetical protein